MRVLYVEDDTEYANLVQRALRSRGEERFSVHHESDLDSALALIEHESFDVLLLDLSLPDVECHYTLGTACNMARSLPVVLLTSAEDERYMEAAGRAGACGYLVKSQLDWRALPELLRRAIVHHEHRD